MNGIASTLHQRPHIGASLEKSDRHGITNWRQEKLFDENSLKSQLNAMVQRSNILASLGIKLPKSVVAAAMILALPDSYATLRSILTSTIDKPPCKGQATATGKNQQREGKGGKETKMQVLRTPKPHGGRVPEEKGRTRSVEKGFQRCEGHQNRDLLVRIIFLNWYEIFKF